MATRFRVTYTDGREVEAATTPRGEVEMERHFNVSVTDPASADTNYYMVWASMTAAGKDGTTYEDWLDSIASVDLVESPKKKAADPTQSGRPRIASSG